MGQEMSNKDAQKRIRDLQQQVRNNQPKTFGKLQKAAKYAKAVGAVVKAIIRMNDKGWYIKYVVPTPAANENRPMEPLFNLSITSDATKGSVCRFVDVTVVWENYYDTFMFNQVVTQMYQRIRKSLKSNLPYSQNFVKAYTINAINLAIIAKHLEKMIGWNSFTDPTVTNFQKMWRSYSDATSYGVSPLKTLEMLDPNTDAWSRTASNYDLLRGMVSGILMLPESLGKFISHYFGSVFVDSDDGKNTQYIRLMPTRVQFAQYNRSDDTYTLSSITVSDAGLTQLISKLDEFQQTYGMLLADLTKSQQLSPFELTPFDSYNYVPVYDPSFNQALVNAYTDAESVTSNGYVRLDRMDKVEDNLTQFIFMGGLQDYNPNPTFTGDDLARVPAIRVISMTLKYDSNLDLSWPAGLTQAADANAAGATRFASPVGISVTSTIQADTYVNIDLDTATSTFSFGTTKDGISVSSTSSTTYNLSGSASSNYVAFSISNNTPSAVLLIPFGYHVLDDTVNKAFNVFVEYLAYEYNNTNNTWAFQKDRCYSVIRATYTYTVTTKAVVFAQAAAAGADLSKSCYINRYGEGSLYRSTDGDSSFRVDAASTWIEAEPLLLKSYELNYNTIPLANTRLVTVTFSFPIGSISVTSKAGWVPVSNEPTTYGYVALATYYDNNVSGIAYQVTAAAAGNSFSYAAGFSMLAGWVADQFDYHIPITMHNRVTINLQNGDSNVIQQEIALGRILLKEAYIPYYYNVADLTPVLYSMLTSLFAPNMNKSEGHPRNRRGARGRRTGRQSDSADDTMNSSD